MCVICTYVYVCTYAIIHCVYTVVIWYSCGYITIAAYFTGDLPDKIEVHSMISTFMDFGIVSASERESIMAIVNANNFSTNYCVTQMDDGITYLEAKSNYTCLTTNLGRRHYLLFLEGGSINDRIERFKFYGRRYAKLRPCLPSNMQRSDEELNETLSDNPWSVTLHPSNEIWREANFNIYGFIHYVHYLLPCTATPDLCSYHANNSTNTCSCT